MEMLEEHRCFEGWQQRWRHDSSTLNYRQPASGRGCGRLAP